MFASKHIPKLFLASCLSLVVTLLCYFLNNCPYPFWDELDMLSVCENGVRYVLDKQEDRRDVLFVNTGYDKDVIDYCINECDTGRVDITDRRKLMDFLQLAEVTNTYKCIFLDIRFEKGYETSVDSALFHQILSMRDVYFSHHSDVTIASDSLLPKAVINDYFTTITKTNFTRYQMIQNGKKSVPLVIDSIVNYSQMKQWGPFYTYNGQLCQNCPFLPIRDQISLTRGDGTLADYMEMGAFYLNFGREMFAEDAKGKIVILGDFVNDRHDTYAGMHPGSYLIYLAYKTLKDRKHVVPISFTILFFLLYLLIFFAVLNKISPISLLRIERFTHNKTLHFLLSLLSFGFVITFASGVLYLSFGIINNIFIPTFAVTLLQYYIQYKEL